MAMRSTGTFLSIALELQGALRISLAEPPQEHAQRYAFGLADSRRNFIDAFVAGLQRVARPFHAQVLKIRLRRFAGTASMRRASVLLLDPASRAESFLTLAD
ncbi:MAG: hypothetical protein DMG41_28890 [Acidobacteria bacterium]|nr:MAG: hypothetical protein AUH13_18125 [Acidobacteria bacterium 13_2_20CM_58_27]PYT84069.1 MAG: hypothetical protein DMG41_28890 [Acidobacteriota bacterium]